MIASPGNRLLAAERPADGAASDCQQADDVVGDGRRGNGGNLGDIVRRRDLDDIGADEVESGQSAHDAERLRRGQTACHRRAGARSEGRVEAIDIEGQIDLAGADALANSGDGGVDTVGAPRTSKP